MASDSSQTEASRKVVQTMVNSAASGDEKLLLSCFHDDLVVYEPSFLPYGGRYQGINGFIGLWAELVKYIDPRSLKLGALLADGERVVCHWTVKTANHDSECNMCESYVIRDGKIAEARIFFNELGSLTTLIK